MVPQQEPFNLPLRRRAQEDGVHFSRRPKGLGRTSYLRKKPTKSTTTISTDIERLSDYYCKSKRKGIDVQHQPSSLKDPHIVSKGRIGCCTKHISSKMYLCFQRPIFPYHTFINKKNLFVTFLKTLSWNFMEYQNLVDHII